MKEDHLETLRLSLPGLGVALGPGLAERELREIEEGLGFAFPSDLRVLLSSFVPEGPEFPDWRHPRAHDLIEWFDYPAEGIAFDVEESGFWWPGWGERPSDPEDAIEEARRQVALAPVLIPVYGHRFLPATPAESGNPLFSIVQTDVIVSSSDLGWYFHDEFGAPEPRGKRPVAKSIAFWSALAESE